MLSCGAVVAAARHSSGWPDTGTSDGVAPDTDSKVPWCLGTAFLTGSAMPKPLPALLLRLSPLPALIDRQTDVPVSQGITHHTPSTPATHHTLLSSQQLPAPPLQTAQKTHRGRPESSHAIRRGTQDDVQHSSAFSFLAHVLPPARAHGDGYGSDGYRCTLAGHRRSASNT